MKVQDARSQHGAVERALREPERSPLGAGLDTELPEENVPEIWHRIDARLTLAEGARPRRTLLASLAVAAVLLLVCGGFWLRYKPAPALLALESGVAPTALNATVQAGSFAFADGSRVELAPQTELRVVRNDARTLVTSLARGRSTFDVRPGGPRRWLVEAGPATVEVVGTRFSVRRDDGSVRVEVERGIVLVRSETLAGGRVRLTAGQSVLVTKPTVAASARDAEFSASSVAPAAPPVTVPSAPSVPTVTPSSAPPAAQVVAAPIALSALPSVPAASTSAKMPAHETLDAVDRALADADAARRHGDGIAAVRALETALAAARPNDKRRGLAALILARLVLRSEPARAAQVLRDAFSAMPADLVEDALARRVEAEGRAGRRDEAARLADDYARRFPAGQRASEVKRWSSE